MAGHGGSKTAVIAAVIGNLIIAIIKFIAAAITGSSAMISEGIHSLVDTGNGGLLLHGMGRAKIPADEGHPFGHGKALYFWTLVVSVSIFGIGGGMSLYEGISHIRHVAPDAVLSDPTVNYIVLGIALLVEGWSFSVAIREFIKAKGSQKSWDYIRGAKDPSTFTIVLEDSAAMAGLVFALLPRGLFDRAGSTEGVEGAPEKGLPMRGVLSLIICDRYLWFTVLALALTDTLQDGFRSFEPLFMQDLGLTQSMIGLASTLSALGEVPFMLWGDRLIRRFGIRQMILFTFVFDLLRRGRGGLALPGPDLGRDRRQHLLVAQVKVKVVGAPDRQVSGHRMHL